MTATTSSVTLTVTNTSGQTEVQTYSWQVPAGNNIASGGTTWPEALAPDLALPSTPAFPSHNLAVRALSGALDTAIAQPAYNPNIPPLVLTYDSLAADPRPTVVEHHALDASQSIPTKVSGQLSFNGTAGSTYYTGAGPEVPLQYPEGGVTTTPSGGINHDSNSRR